MLLDLAARRVCIFYNEMFFHEVRAVDANECPLSFAATAKSARNGTDFKATCLETGMQPKCCTLDVGNIGLLCIDAII